MTATRAQQKDAARGQVRMFKYRCVDCGKINKSPAEASGCMVHCERCGFFTVQTCEGVEVR